MTWFLMFLFFFADEPQYMRPRQARIHGNVRVETLCNKYVDCRQPARVDF